jgi:hypothetical protein
MLMSHEIGITQAEAAATGRMHVTKIRDHQPVVGSDGEPVGTVDSIDGDSIKLTKSDPEARGRHHYIPLSAVANVDHSVRLSLPAADAIRTWQEGDGPDGGDLGGDTGGGMGSGGMR